jgi:tetratricopeptide (TPR) repeat protein
MSRFMLTVVAALVCLTLVSIPSRAQSASELGTAGWRAIDADPDQAAVLFARALTLQPGDPALHVGAGAAAYQRGRTTEATRALRRALDLDPAFTAASRLLGEIAYKDGDLPLAIRTYERALAHAPGNGELAGRLERIAGEMARLESAASGVERITIAVSGPADQASEALAARAAEVLDSTYWRVAKLVGAFPSEPIAVVLDMASRFRGAEDAPDGAEPERATEVRVSAAGASAHLEAFDRLLAHELTHAAVRKMAPHGVPAWLAEGLALYIEPADVDAAAGRLRTDLDTAWANMTGPLLSGDRPARDASLLAVHALVARIGRKSTVVLDDLSDGRSLDAAFARFGFTLEHLRADVARMVTGSAR